MDRFKPKAQIAFWVTAGACALFVMEFFFLRSYLWPAVFVNGDRLVLPRATSVKALLQREQARLKRGDVTDRTGRILKAGAGGRPLVLVNGRRVGPDWKLKPLDRISIRKGSDLKERVQKRVDAVHPKTKVRGVGAFVFVSEYGNPGMEETSYGDKSGLIFETRVIKRPTAATVRRFDPRVPKVALTFDDGPSPRTPKVLDVLDEKGVPATFFIVGKHAEKYPRVLREIAARGYGIGNHTYSHDLLADAAHGKIHDELRRCELLIEELAGRSPRWFRPPGGSLSSLLLKTAEAEGYRLVLWSVDPADWNRAKRDNLAGRVLGEAGPGSVVLLHDGGGGSQATVTALPAIIDGLRAKGYELVGLDELIAESGRPD